MYLFWHQLNLCRQQGNINFHMESQLQEKQQDHMTVLGQQNGTGYRVQGTTTPPKKERKQNTTLPSSVGWAID